MGKKACGRQERDAPDSDLLKAILLQGSLLPRGLPLAQQAFDHGHLTVIVIFFDFTAGSCGTWS